MRIAQIENGVVTNVIEADSVWTSSEAISYVESDTAGIGWMLVDGELQPAPVDYLSLAEAFIKDSFSTAQLLQAKVWLDLLPHESTPKLMQLFAWTGAVTGQAILDSSTFPQPPVTFREVAMECLPLLQ